MTIKKIFIHHSDISQNISSQFERINEAHKEKWNFPSPNTKLFGGYNYLCETNGEIKQYRLDGEEQAAQKGENTETLSICLAGNFNGETPTLEQKQKLAEFLEEKTLRYGLGKKDIFGHKENLFSNTACPGVNLMNWIINYRNQDKLNFIQAQIELIRKAIAGIFILLNGKKG